MSARVQRWTSWGLDDFLTHYPGFALRPSSSGAIVLVGDCTFTAVTNTTGSITDTYRLHLTIPSTFPREPLRAWELARRIDSTFHKLTGGALCLGSPFQLARLLQRFPTVRGFFEAAVIPYLAGHAYYERTHEMPFGELDHGNKGLLTEFRSLFGFVTDPQVIAGLQLLGMKKRIANKHPCPCGSGLRLGRCHARRLNRLRGDTSRAWFRGEAAILSKK